MGIETILKTKFIISIKVKKILDKWKILLYIINMNIDIIKKGGKM